MTVRNWLRDKALELTVSVLAVACVGFISVTFVSEDAYAEDQKAIIAAIQNIAPALSKQLKVDRLQREMKETDQLRQRLIRYRNADPDSALSTARSEEIDALEGRKDDLKTELEVALSNLEP